MLGSYMIASGDRYQSKGTLITGCMQVAEEHYNGRPIPLFGYNRKDGFLDLMFPDFTYFGHEYSQITGATATC
jgi:hypothetical protein